MADDAAAPDGELTETPETGLDSSPDGTTESPDVPRPLEPDADVHADSDVDSQVDSDVAADAEDDPRDHADAVPDVTAAALKPPRSNVAVGAAFGLVAVLGLSAVAGWLGCHAYQAHQAEQQRALFVQVGKQAALNLTTIDYEHVD